MDYSTFVGLIKERNRPSGGIRTIHNVAINAFVNSKKKMLEIGSNTGFASVNMSLLTGCKVIGIDINQKSIDEAIMYAKQQGINHKVKFIKASALKLPFKENKFDIVWASNVTSFISNKTKAIEEYSRVLKPGGILAIIPIYYIKNVPNKILTDVSRAIGSDVKRWDKKFWISLFTDTNKLDSKYKIELFYQKDFKYLDRSDFISQYTEEVINKNISKKYPSEDLLKIKNRFKYFINLFNNNLKYAGFSILLFQKRTTLDETELFITQEV